MNKLKRPRNDTSGDFLEREFNALDDKFKGFLGEEYAAVMIVYNHEGLRVLCNCSQANVVAMLKASKEGIEEEAAKAVFPA